VDQTLDLPLPDWLEAWNAPWTCHRDPQARPLLTTDECATCARWQPRATAAGARATRPPA